MNRLKVELAQLGRAALSIFLVTAVPALAENQIIQLSAEDEKRLDIRYEHIDANTPEHGFIVPAQVISSPEQSSHVTTFFGGTLVRWMARGGQAVQQGQVIAVIHSPELMALQEQYLAAKIHRQNMDQQLNKDEQLLAEGIISEQRVQQSLRAQKEAEFGLQARRQQLYQAQISDDDLDALRRGEHKPGEYFLRAPLQGDLNRALFAVGQRLNAGQTIASVTDTSSLWLRAQLPLKMAQLIEEGDSLRVENDAATVTLFSKNSAVSSSSQRVAILARFDQSTSLYPGQQVSLVVPVNRSGSLIPASAVTHTEDKTVVYVKSDSGIEARELDLIPLGRDYLTTATFAANEQLVVQGSAQLKGIQLGLGGGE